MRSGTFRFTGVVLAAGLLWAGCSNVDGSRQSSDVAFTTDDDTYSAGDEVVLTLRNLYDQPIGYNLCSSGLQRDVNGEWEPVVEDRICTMQLDILEPGEVDSYAVELPDTLADGSYRYNTSIQGMRDTNEPPGQQALATPPFQVE